MNYFMGWHPLNKNGGNSMSRQVFTLYRREDSSLRCRIPRGEHSRIRQQSVAGLTQWRSLP